MKKTTLLAALAAIFLAGCGGDGSSSPEDGQDPVSRRMHDKEYVGRLQKQVDARKEILREMAEAKKALAAAEAEGRTGAELAAFSNAVSSAIAKFEKNREQSIALVSAQMRGANDEKLKQKGK